MLAVTSPALWNLAFKSELSTYSQHQKISRGVGVVLPGREEDRAPEHRYPWRCCSLPLMKSPPTLLQLTWGSG